MREQIIKYFNGNYLPFFEKYLEKIKPGKGSEFSALCPFHDDNNPSLSFNGSTGKFFCHTCKVKGNFFQFYAEKNNLNGNFPAILEGIAKDFNITVTELKSIIVETYDYTDAEGNLIFQAVRFEPKDFRQRRPDGNGGWIWDLKGVEPVLYRLPEVIKAESVVIVEGEKDVHNLLKIGFIATSAPMGAEKWRDSYNQYLEGKEVILIPDNDEPGRKHVQQIAKSLHGIARTIKIIELPGLPIHGDISDFISGFQDKEESGERLSIIIENAEPYEPDKELAFNDVILTVETLSELKIEKQTCLLNPWLKESSINFINGWRGSGKTWTAFGIIDAITSGGSFGPWTCEKPEPCLFIDGEMTIQDDQERINYLRLYKYRKAPFYFYSDSYASQLGFPRARLTDSEWQHKIKSFSLENNIKLVVFDNIASLCPGIDENSKQDWDPINQYLLELRFTGISSLLLHHTGKSGEQRGTSAREDNADVSIRLDKPVGYLPEDGAHFVIHFMKARIPNRDLNLIADTEFKLIQNQDGFYEWSTANVRQNNKDAIVSMIADGVSQKDIAESLGVSKGYVSRVKKEAELCRN